MLSKQFVCGCSKSILSVILLVSFLSLPLSLYGGGSVSRYDEDGDISSERGQDEFGGYDGDFLKEAYEDSPQDVRYIINFLKDPNYALGEEDRFAVFYGGPGTGKSIQSLVVPYMAGWRCANRKPDQVQVKERNGTARNISDDMAKALEPGEKVVYIMQEFNKLVDHPKSTSHDADTASAALWNALDQYNKNPNFYFIGSTNNLENIAEQLKDRFLPQIVEFHGMQTQEAKKKAFMRHVFGDRARQATNCTDEFLDNIVQGCTSLPIQSSIYQVPERVLNACSTHRDFRALGILTRKFARFDNPIGYHAEITSDHITKAKERMRRAKLICRYGKEEETDQEQRERHHEKSVDQSYQLHALNLEQDILKSRHTTLVGSISNNGVNDLIGAQPKEIEKYIDYKENYGFFGTLRDICIDSNLNPVGIQTKKSSKHH